MAQAPKKEEKQELVPKEEAGLPAVIDFASDAGSGFEDAGASAYAIPFLRILQALSKQCKKSEPEYIKGAEEGDFYNTVTGQIYKGDDGVLVIPCYFEQKFNLWKPRETGGGLVKVLTPSEAEAIHTTKNSKNQDITDDGMVLVDTRNHYLIVINPDGTTSPALLALTSTQLKKSRKWMSLMQSLCNVPGKEKPMYSQIYRLTPIPESNDTGSWSGLNFEHVKQIDDVNLYLTAKTFHDQVKKGEAKAAAPDDDMPF